jgi:hypothetical protein
VQQAERGGGHEPPAEHEPERARRASLADERNADRDENDRQQIPRQPEEPADERVERTAERPAEVEVHGQRQHGADTDQHHADEVMLLAGHGVAELGGSGVAPPRVGWREITRADARRLRGRLRRRLR